MSRELIFMDTNVNRLAERLDEFNQECKALWADSGVRTVNGVDRHFVRVIYELRED